MIKLFKDHSSKTCLLDDFEFYENRQKTIEEVKAKRQTRKKASFFPLGVITNIVTVICFSILLLIFISQFDLCLLIQKVLEDKPTDGIKDGTEEALVKSPESLGTTVDLKEPTSIDQSDEQVKPLENGTVAEAGDGLKKSPEPVVEEVVITN